MRRNSLDVWADILNAARDGLRKTHIVYKANLNFNVAKKYFTKLIERGFLEYKDAYYVTTPEGIQFLTDYEKFIMPLRNMHKTG
jgi:predicted transcriptional regulator